MEGTVKWFNDTRGYGFITPTDGSADVFVHYTGIVGDGRKTLQEGQKVEFEVAQGDRGPKANEVTVPG
jgi:CspA family cold shock protein